MKSTDILASIRYDPVSKKGSVLDAIQLVTGQKNGSQLFQRMQEKYPDISEKISMHKFAGHKQKPTSVASLPVLFRIMAVLPGSRARNFNKSTMDVFCRAFGADASLIEEIRQRERIQNTRFANVATDITTTIEDAMATLTEPIEPPRDHGVMYIATSPFQTFFKVGFWTGTAEALRSRYTMYYGASLDLWMWECATCRDTETHVLHTFAKYSMGGEVLDKTCLPDVRNLLDALTSDV